MIYIIYVCVCLCWITSSFLSLCRCLIRRPFRAEAPGLRCLGILAGFGASERRKTKNFGLFCAEAPDLQDFTADCENLERLDFDWEVPERPFPSGK